MTRILSRTGKIAVGALAALLLFLALVKADALVTSSSAVARRLVPAPWLGILWELVAGFLLIAGRRVRSVLLCCLMFIMVAGAWQMLEPARSCGCMGRLSTFQHAQAIGIAAIGVLASLGLLFDDSHQCPAHRLEQCGATEKP
jgi:hypothetical protein